MKFLVTITVCTDAGSEIDTPVIEREYEAEIEAGDGFEACEIAQAQTDRIYPDKFIATCARDL